jgi:hypothetical protein
MAWFPFITTPWLPRYPGAKLGVFGKNSWLGLKGMPNRT